MAASKAAPNTSKAAPNTETGAAAPAAEEPAKQWISIVMDPPEKPGRYLVAADGVAVIAKMDSMRRWTRDNGATFYPAPRIWSPLPSVPMEHRNRIA